MKIIINDKNLINAPEDLLEEYPDTLLDALRVILGTEDIEDEVKSIVILFDQGEEALAEEILKDLDMTIDFMVEKMITESVEGVVM